MSASGSPFSSNRRIEPAVAVKSSVRPGKAKRLPGRRIRRQTVLLGGPAADCRALLHPSGPMAADPVPAPRLPAAAAMARLALRILRPCSGRDSDSEQYNHDDRARMALHGETHRHFCRLPCVPRSTSHGLLPKTATARNPRQSQSRQRWRESPSSLAVDAAPRHGGLSLATVK